MYRIIHVHIQVLIRYILYPRKEKSDTTVTVVSSTLKLHFLYKDEKRVDETALTVGSLFSLKGYDFKMDYLIEPF
jgi:hypothetical protein